VTAWTAPQGGFVNPAFKSISRYQDIPDPDHNSELSLPLITVTDFKTGEAGKEVILLIAGEHARQVKLTQCSVALQSCNSQNFLSLMGAADPCGCCLALRALHAQTLPELRRICRELITSEIVYWLYQVLTGKDAELLSWPAAASFASQRKQMGLGAGNLQDWVQDLLKKVVFKVLPRGVAKESAAL